MATKDTKGRKLLTQLWKRAKSDKDTYKKLVLAHEYFKGREWDALDQLSRRTGVYENAKPSGRYWVQNLSEEDQVQLKKDLATLPIAELCAKYPERTKLQLENASRRMEIRRPQVAQAEAPAATRPENQYDENALITARESGKISPDEFGGKLQGLFRARWDAVNGLVVTKRQVRTTDFLSLTKELQIESKTKTEKVNEIRGILTKFEELGLLCSFDMAGGHRIYVSNLSGVYSAEELLVIVPTETITLVLGSLNEPQSRPALEQRWKRNIGINLLATILPHYVKEGVVSVKKNGTVYQLTDVAEIVGTDPASLQAMELFKAENLLDQEAADKAPEAITNWDALEQIAADDLVNKSVKPVVVEVSGDCFDVAMMGEVRIGNQFTDYGLINFAREQFTRRQPHVIVTSGLVQGDYKSHQVERLRALTEGPLSRVSAQIKAAGLLLTDLEQCTQHQVWDILSDDDWNIGKSRTLIAMKELLGLRRAGFEGGLYPEQISRLAGRDYVNYLQKQWEYVGPYMHRMGKTLPNRDEANQIVPGIDKEGFLIILMILLFKKFGHPIPEDFTKIINPAALFGDLPESKRHVTPDPLILDWVDKESGQLQRRFQFVHNTAYSDVTQYLDSLVIAEKVLRQVQARGEMTPDFMFDFHQERFFGTRVQNTYVFNLPGCQNTLLGARRQLKTFNTQIVGEKSHKQNTFRKEPVTPGVPRFEVLKDGRFRFNIMTNNIRRVVENSKMSREVRETLLLIQDIQTGSITMRPEWVIKAHDYGLYTRQAKYVSYNGDIVHGTIYPQHYAENRPKRLVSNKSQQAFVETAYLKPFYPAPNVKAIDRVMGNHEWNNTGVKREGMDPLGFMESCLQGRYEGFRMGGGKLPYDDIQIWPRSRNRIEKSGNPGGATVQWPYYTRETDSGFRYAVQHMWQQFGGGRTPVDEQLRWITNMARAAEDIDVMLGGDKHSFWVAVLAETLCLQMPGLIDQSGYELARGLTPLSALCLVEFSNQEGVVVEIIPIEFLEAHQCISPFYADKNELLVRPAPGSREHRFGLDGPYCHQLEEECDSGYPPS